jgi:hypothetical protein
MRVEGLTGPFHCLAGRADFKTGSQDDRKVVWMTGQRTRRRNDDDVYITHTSTSH